MRVVLRCDCTYLFDEIACFLSPLFKIFQLVHVDFVEKRCCVRTCLVELLLVAQVGFAINLPLEAVNEGLVAVDGFLEN